MEARKEGNSMDVLLVEDDPKMGLREGSCDKT